jgi:hypothetical protein
VAGGWVANYAFDQQRERFDDALRAIEASTGDAFAKVVFAHVFSPPHAPLLFDSAGRDLAAPKCLPSRCALWDFPDEAWEQMTDQIQYLNRRLLATVQTIVEADPDAAIVLLSDHGSRRWADDVDEHFHSFFASRTPGRDVFVGAAPQPVNVFRLLGAAYLGTPTQPLPYRAWRSPVVNRPLETEPLSLLGS